MPVMDKKGKKPANSPIIEHVLRPPTLGYPKDKERQVILEENLKRMGCGMLWDLLWRYADEKMLKEVIAQRSTSFPSSIWAKTDDWTVEMWSKKWLLCAEVKNLPLKKYNLAKEYFVGIHSSKDGWKTFDCNHQELREVLEFLIPLITSNKPKWVTIQVASAVVDCLINKVKYSWAKIIEGSIRSQVTKLRTVTVSYLAAYCLNLYQVDGLLIKPKQKAWKALKWSLTFGNKYLQKNPDEENEEMELDREEDPAPHTTPKTKTTPWKLERLSEEKKKPTEEKCNIVVNWFYSNYLTKPKEFVSFKNKCALNDSNYVC
jgi:hypothetical protein